MIKSGKAKEPLMMLIMVLLGLCAYSSSLDGGFVFDDLRICNNPAVQQENLSFAGLADALENMEPRTRPVANLSFVLNYSLHEFDVRGYHLANLLIHILTGIVFYLFLRTTFSLPVLREKFPAPEWTAFAAALVWLVHPLQTQAVSYIIQRMTSLSGLFYLLAMLLYARARVAGTSNRRYLLFGGAALAGLLALGSKENALTLPLFIILYEWFFLQDLRIQWLREKKWLLAGISIALAAVPFFMFGGEFLDVVTGGYAERDFTLSERVLTQFRVLFLYLSLIALPLPARLSLEHDFAVSTSLFSPVTTLPAIAAVAALIGCALYLAPRERFPAFCILWFFGTHLVESSILPLEMVFEHRNYLPSMMVICLVVIGAIRLVKSWRLLFLFLCIVVGFFSFWTYQRNLVWQDPVSLWSDSVQKAPDRARAHNNLAVALKNRGRLKEAVIHYQEAITRDPDYVEAYYNLGNVMVLIGNYDHAAHYYRKAVQLAPGMAVLHASLADALFDGGRFEEAESSYRQSLKIEPDNPEAKEKLERTVRMLEAVRLKKSVR